MRTGSRDTSVVQGTVLPVDGGRVAVRPGTDGGRTALGLAHREDPGPVSI
ncbi:hypothetical protein ACFYOY_14730 [Streptomyces sp. NPDC007875]